VSDPKPAAAVEGDASIRVSPEIRRWLLTVQYEQKMGGVSVSFSDIIGWARAAWEVAQS
jgi:hypothetical protein